MSRKVIVVMPAYNASKTLRAVYEETRVQQAVDEVILVDDASTDDTARVARELGLAPFVHPRNAGYGANQKTCYIEALKRQADVVIMLHADNQYDAGFIPEMLKPIHEGIADVVLGSRMLMRNGALRGGMPFYKYVANRTLTEIENLCLHLKLTDMHTGYRAYTRKVLETIPFLRNSNDFVFDTQMLVQARAFGFTVREIPVSTRYLPENSSIGFKASVVYGLKTLMCVFRYLLHQWGIAESKLLL